MGNMVVQLAKAMGANVWATGCTANKSLIAGQGVTPLDYTKLSTAFGEVRANHGEILEAATRLFVYSFRIKWTPSLAARIRLYDLRSARDWSTSMDHQ